MSNQDDSGFVQMEIDLGLDDENLNAWDGNQSSVDPGIYSVEVEGSTTSEASTGTNQLELTYRVISEGPMQGKKQKAWYALKQSDGCRARLKNLLIALGEPLGKIVPSRYVGRQLQIEVYEEEYQGKYNARVRAEKPLEGSAPVGVKPPTPQPQRQAQQPQQQAQPQQGGQQTAQGRPTRPPPRPTAPQNGQKQ